MPRKRALAADVPSGAASADKTARLDSAAQGSSGTQTAADSAADGCVQQTNADDTAQGSGQQTSKTEPESAAASGGRLVEADEFELDVHAMAKWLLGKVLVRRQVLPADDGCTTTVLLRARIVETEAYPGSTDPASHSYKGKTARNAAMFMRPGTVYVYNIYGTLQCVNISARGDGAAVLIRAAQPLQVPPLMRTNRARHAKANKTRELPLDELCNGPSKLCQALAITKQEFNERHLCDEQAALYLMHDGTEYNEQQIVVSTRIGIEGSGPECARQPFRYYVSDNRSVSRRAKPTSQSTAL